MKKIVIFLLSIAFALNAYAGEPADKKLAIEFLQVSQFEQVIEASIGAYSRQLLGSAPNENRIVFEKNMRDMMGWEATKDDLANLVIGLYSKGELEAYLAFVKTPLGASFNAKNVQFSDDFSVLLANNIQKFIQQVPVPMPSPAGHPNTAP